MYLSDARLIKHELRTPINHIVGYSALLLEAAQDRGDTPLSQRAAEIQAVGSELNRVIERGLQCSEQTLRLEDIGAIRDTIVPLIRRVADLTALPPTPAVNDEGLADVRRIATAVERLQAMLATLFVPERPLEPVEDARQIKRSPLP